MTSPGTYRLLADIVLVIHFAFVAFVVIGLLITWLGYFLRWAFVRNFYFRATHILAMAVVLLESIFGIVCPLTDWEMTLRKLGGQTPYGDQGFMHDWVHTLLFLDLQPSTFTIGYACFFIALVLSFIFVFPELPWRKEKPVQGKPETENDPRDS